MNDSGHAEAREPQQQSGPQPEDAPKAVSKTTGLALLLQDLFQKLASKGSGDQRPLFQAWRDELALPETPGQTTALYQAMVWVSASIDRLEKQVDEALTIADGSRKVYRGTLSGMRSCVDVGSLFQTVNQHWDKLTPTRLEHLTLMNDGLIREYPESVAETAAQASMFACLDEMGRLLGQANLPPLMFNTVKVRLDMLRWAIDNWALVGTEAVADATGQTAVAVRRACTILVQSPQGQEIAGGLSTKMIETIDWLGRIDITYKIVDLAIEHAAKLKLIPSLLQ